MIEKEHVISILKETKTAIQQENVSKLRDLSNQTIHSASVYQDPENITLAVVLYSLSKFLERSNYKEYKIWPKFLKNTVLHINEAIIYLQKENYELFSEELKEMREEIEKFGNLRQHIKDVLERARINKASRIYEHGISLEKTSKLLGVSMFELSEYSGQTGIPDIDLNITLSVKKRLNNAMELFK